MILNGGIRQKKTRIITRFYTWHESHLTKITAVFNSSSSLLESADSLETFA